MLHSADLPCRTSSIQDQHGLDRQSVSAPSPARRVARLIRRATLALSIPAALIAAVVAPAAQPAATPAAPVAASVELASNAAAGTLQLGVPRLNATTGTTTTALNLRSGPGTGYRVITVLPAGTQGTVLSTSGSWYKISTSRGTGWVSRTYFRTGTLVAQPVSSSSVVSIARQYVGYPYVYGAAGPNAFDCSGFTQYVFRRAGITLYGRSAAAQFNTPGTRIRSYSALQPGDLVFFANTYKPGISHVGIYVGGGQMIHAGSTRTGVAYANINGSYYTSRFAGGVRPYR